MAPANRAIYYDHIHMYTIVVTNVRCRISSGVIPYLSDFVRPNGRCPDPDDYFKNGRRAWTQLNRHNIAVERQK